MFVSQLIIDQNPSIFKSFFVFSADMIVNQFRIVSMDVFYFCLALSPADQSTLATGNCENIRVKL